MSQYNCRTCPVRDRCIDQSSNASSIKLMMYNAFENRTDTLATWGRLQKNCLLEIEAKKAERARVNGKAFLSHRLEQAREERQRKNTPQDHIPAAQAFGLIGLEELDSRRGNASREAEAITQLQHKHGTTMLKPPAASRPTTSTNSSAFWLTIEGTWRHITVPENGKLVFGRFDPNIGVPPDIDLSFEDQHTHLVSRRHALFVGKNGKYTIEDLGSISGVFLNDEKLGFGPSRYLQPGDRIQIGDVQLTFDQIPAVIFDVHAKDWARHTMTVTATGQKFIINPSSAIVIGRGDQSVHFTPDIDLSTHGRIAQRVSRRHARILWRNGQPYVEDMGSGFGTRLRGETLFLGEAIPLTPGDHISLAGCVLAYDIEVSPTVAQQPAAAPQAEAYVD